MQVKILLKLFIILLGLSSASVAGPRHFIKLALFDNPQPDPTRNEAKKQFINSYLAGVNTAITVAASEGIIINEKEFFHENNLASIIQQASTLKEFEPDVIVGLSTSNDFLMSRAFFGEQVILSISATGSALSTLPSNFYSLGIPDTSAVNTMINFIYKHYPNSNLFITAAAESKESVDFGDLLKQAYNNRYKNKKVIERKFLADDMNNLSIAKFMDGYHQGDVIVVMSIGYDSAIDLMNKITAYLYPIKPVFVTSTDNWGNSVIPQKILGIFDAYRIDTLSGGEDTKFYKIFIKNYINIYHDEPKDKISYVTYQAVMSVIDAINLNPEKQKKLTTKRYLLQSYLSALKKHPNWFRPPYYVVYKLEKQNEKFYEKIT